LFHLLATTAVAAEWTFLLAKLAKSSHKAMPFVRTATDLFIKNNIGAANCHRFIYKK